MKESLFLQAENLRNKIHQIENCIENYKQSNMSKICICWDEPSENIRHWIEEEGSFITIKQAIPTELEQDIIKLLEDKLEEYKKEFNEL